MHEIVLPLDPARATLSCPRTGPYGPAAPIWTYTTPSLFSFVMSSGQRMPNGNTLICSAEQKWIFEVTPSGQLVWEHFTSGGNPFHAHYTERSLWASDTNLSAATGGRIDFDLLQGTRGAGELYLLLCSASGTVPGTPFLGVNIPLNIDPFLRASATYPNAAPTFIQTFGTLSGLGRAVSAFTLPTGLPGGYQLDFAYIRFTLTPGAVNAVSNPVPVQIL